MIQRSLRRRLGAPSVALCLVAGALTLTHVPLAGEPPAEAAAPSPLAPGSRRVSVSARVAARAGAPTHVLSSTATTSMSTVRWFHDAVPISGGRVLVVGGNPGTAATTAEIFDPATGLWTPTAPMLFGHAWPVAAPLCDGRVLVAAGASASNHDAEVYDPVTDTWAEVGKTKLGHTYGNATLLPDCRVLVSGGYDSNWYGEVFNPATGTFKLLTDKWSVERFFHSVTVLADGRVLAAGGGVPASGHWLTRRQADILDPATGKWNKVAPMKYRRRAHTATLLPDGRVLVAGGTDEGKNDGTDPGIQLRSAEIYDPLANTWTEVAELNVERGLHTAALLPSGAVMVLGGLDLGGSASREVEVFHDGVWTQLDSLLVDRFHHASAPLADGRVLVMGGVHQATAEIYALGQLGEPCVTGVTCAGGICADGVCCDSPCAGGCRRCDVAGREGTCMAPCASDLEAYACPSGGIDCEDAACITVHCSPYRCDADQGVCRAGCSSVDDCEPGYACDLEGQCVLPPDVSSSDAGCAVAVRSWWSPGRASWLTGAWLAALTGVALAFGLRRARRGRGAASEPDRAG